MKAPVMRNKCVSTPCRPVRRLLALACLLLLLPVAAMAQHRQENSPIEYYGTDEPDGYVWNAPLTYLARPDHAQALTDLVVRQLVASPPDFRPVAASDPHDLAVAVALAQCDGMGRSGRISMLSRMDRNKMSDDELFKLGANLYYAYGGTTEGGDVYDADKLATAKDILGRLWQTKHVPIVGLMMMQSLEDTGLPSDRCFATFREQDFEDELVKSAGGDSVCALYRAAQSNGWRASPPPASLVPVANRRVLTAVVAALWDEYGPKTPRGHEVNGRWLPVPWVYTPVELAAQRYFDKWYALMRSSIGMPHILSMQMPKPPARGYPPPPTWFVRAVKTMHPALPRLNAKRRPGKKGA